jgi:hypothetical protein
MISIGSRDESTTTEGADDDREGKGTRGPNCCNSSLAKGNGQQVKQQQQFAGSSGRRNQQGLVMLLYE